MIKSILMGCIYLNYLFPQVSLVAIHINPLRGFQSTYRVFLMNIPRLPDRSVGTPGVQELKVGQDACRPDKIRRRRIFNL